MTMAADGKFQGGAASSVSTSVVVARGQASVQYLLADSVPLQLCHQLKPIDRQRGRQTRKYIAQFTAEMIQQGLTELMRWRVM